MIELKGVSKRYGNKYAVRDASFTIEKGVVLGFLGRNGAGKSTTMNMITGYISASAGTITLDGYDILKNPREVKRRIGYLPEFPPLYGDMTADEYLRFACSIKEIKGSRVKGHLDDICELTRITDVRHRLIRNLSKGYKQRVGLAMALIGSPEVIILDEPTVGLDPRQIIEIRTLIKELGKNHTVVLSSHILKEVSDVCDHVVIINKGSIVAQDTLENLTASVNDVPRLTLRATGEAAPLMDAFSTLEGVVRVDCLGEKEANTNDYLIETAPEADVRLKLQDILRAQDRQLLMLKRNEMDLEDIFLRLTADEGEDAGESKEAGEEEESNAGDLEA